MDEKEHFKNEAPLNTQTSTDCGKRIEHSEPNPENMDVTSTNSSAEQSSVSPHVTTTGTSVTEVSETENVSKNTDKMISEESESNGLDNQNQTKTGNNAESSETVTDQQQIANETVVGTHSEKSIEAEKITAQAPWDDYKPSAAVSSVLKEVKTEDATPQTEQDTTSKTKSNRETIAEQDGACARPDYRSELLSPVAAANAMTQGAGSDDKVPLQSVYHIKWIRFNNKPMPIVTQNENGPCPLIALMNALFLSEKIHLPSVMEMVTSGQLMEYLGDYIFEHAPKDISEDAQLNYEQNMHDAMAVFHKLQTGLDVNVSFTGVGDFEYTSECIVFDLLRLRLYHGWLVDPQDHNTVAAVGNCSYNQLVEKIIAQKSSDKQELITEALTAEAFLENSMSQLTYHGLSELNSVLKENEMCVFFRNNHFSTVYKHNNELFLLVTDQGFLTESNVVWETLSNVEGDSHFVDCDFRTFHKAEPSTAPVPLPEVPVGSDLQIDQDYLVALSLQQEHQVKQEQEVRWQQAGLSDHDLAMQLQEEENKRAADAQQVAQQSQSQPTPPGAALGNQAQNPPSGSAGNEAAQRKKDKNNDCIIL